MPQAFLCFRLRLFGAFYDHVDTDDGLVLMFQGHMGSLNVCHRFHHFGAGAITFRCSYLHISCLFLDVTWMSFPEERIR